MMKRAIMGCVVLWTLAAMATEAPGALLLRFESGGDVLTFDDTGTPGFVEPTFPTFVGDFEVSFTFGQLIGTGVESIGIDLHVDITSLAAGELIIELTATNLDLASAVTLLSNYLGGISLFPPVAADAISFTVGFDDNNAAFALPPGSTIGPLLVGGSNYTAPSEFLAVTGEGPFSLTQRVVITATEAGQLVVFDSGAIASGTAAVPEPGTLAVWAGLGLGLVLAGRRRRRG